MRILTLTKETQQNILENLLKRSPNSYGEYEGRVNAIIEEVRANRDAAVFSYTKKFDGADIDAGNILVTEEEIREAYEKVDPKLLSVIRKALVNIRDYHSRQRQNSWFDSQESGIILGQKVTPLARVGVYVPGGKAVYPSGVSNFLPHHIENLLQNCRIKPAVDQIEFHPGYTQEMTVEYCKNHQILVQAWSPIGRSVLLGNAMLQEIAGHYQVSVAQLCIRYALQRGIVPLPKSSSAERMKQNQDVFGFEISREDMFRMGTMAQTGWSGQHPDTGSVVAPSR